MCVAFPTSFLTGCPHILTTVINTFDSAAIDLHLYLLIHRSSGWRDIGAVSHSLCRTVSDVISICGMEYHQFADDTHLFIEV